MCGCDGKVYHNQCNAQLAKVSIDYQARLALRPLPLTPLRVSVPGSGATSVVLPLSVPAINIAAGLGIAMAWYDCQFISPGGLSLDFLSISE